MRMGKSRNTLSILLALAMILSIGVLPEKVQAVGFDMHIETPKDGGTYNKGEAFAIRVSPDMVSYVNYNYVQIQILKNGKQVDFMNVPYNSLDTVATSYTPTSTGTYTVKAGYSPVSQNSWYGTPTDSVTISVVDPKEALQKMKPGLTTFRFTRTLTVLTWDYMENYGTEIYRSTAKNGTFKKIKTLKKNTENNGVTGYEDTGISGDGTFYYKIRLFKKIGSKTYYSKFSDVKAATTKGIPEIRSLTNTKKGVKIVWTASSFANRYFVFRRNGENSDFVGEVKAGKTFCYDKKAKAGKTYYYEVKAYNDKEDRGKASQEKKIKIPKK